MKIGQFARQAPECDPFFGLQAVKELSIIPVRNLRQHGQNAAAPARQGKQLDAAVLGLVERLIQFFASSLSMEEGSGLKIDVYVGEHAARTNSAAVLNQSMRFRHERLAKA